MPVTGTASNVVSVRVVFRAYVHVIIGFRNVMRVRIR